MLKDTMKDVLVTTGGVGALLGLVVLFVVIAFAPMWITLSLITSGVKAVTDDCGTTYKVEKVLGGDWFCPEEK